MARQEGDVNLPARHAVLGFLPGLAGLALAFVLALVPGVARADFYVCFKGGKETWTNRLMPGQKCRLVMRTDAASSAKGTSGGTTSGGTASKQTWKPPKTATLPIPSAETARPEVDATILEASERYDIPEPFIRAVIEVESNYKVRALSYKGAMGLMQLMPGTAADMGVTNPYDPYQNIMGGTRFLRILANRFSGDIPKVLAAYHAGGSSVATADGIPYQGTDGYVRKVLDHYYRLKTEKEAAVSSGQWARCPRFAITGTGKRHAIPTSLPLPAALYCARSAGGVT